MQTTKNSGLLTTNQLIDKIEQLPIDSISPALGCIRQNLIDVKKGHPKGGLIVEPNTRMILFLINQAKASPRCQPVQKAAFDYA